MTDAEARAASTIAQLSSNGETRIIAARTVKNAVVGNPTNKSLYLRLGAFPPLLAAAADVATNPALVEQAVAALGSLASLLVPDAVASVTPILLSAIFSQDARPVNAAARALKMLVTAEGADLGVLGPAIVTPNVANRLVKLLSGCDEGIAEVCAVILSKTSVGFVQANIYEQAGAIPALVLLLCRTNHERCIEACLNAMSELARQDRSIAQTLVRTHSIIAIVRPFTRSQIHSLRLSACRLLTIFHSAVQLPSGLDDVVTTALVGLLSTDDVSSQIATAHTLAELVLSSEDLQRVATEAEAIEKLADVVKDFPSTDDPMDAKTNDTRGDHHDQHRDMDISQPTSADRAELQAAALTAMAALCSNFDDAREKVVELHVLQNVIASLSASEGEVVLASMKCIRSLSRSVKIVRRDIASESIGRIMLSLVGANNPEICRVASATLCNLVLEFSPIRTVVLEKEGISVLVNLLKSEDEELRKHGLWGVRNLLFKAEFEDKTAVMEKLGYDNLLVLCSDRHPRVRALAMTVLRNLASCGSSESQKRMQLDALLWAIGDRLIGLLGDALRIDIPCVDIAVQALYVICNIASGTEEHKTMLMNSNIPQLILKWTQHENENARIAAIWCAINLSWKERPAEYTRPMRVVKRTSRSLVRSQNNRMELLRRQHLPLPSSPAARRELERSNPISQNLLALEREQRAENSDSTAQDSGELQQAEQESNGSDANLDTVMSTQTEERREQKNSGYEWRIGRLRELGFEGRLRSLVNDPHIEVQGRARAALEQFDCNDVCRLDYDPSALLDYNTSLMARQSPRSPPVQLRVPESDSSSAGSST